MEKLTRELVDIIGDEIVIRFPVSALTIAAPIAWERHSPKSLRVTDLWNLSREVLNQLQQEKDNGDTLVTDMLDAAVVRAVENGAEGIEIEERP